MVIQCAFNFPLASTFSKHYIDDFMTNLYGCILTRTSNPLQSVALKSQLDSGRGRYLLVPLPFHDLMLVMRRCRSMYFSQRLLNITRTSGGNTFPRPFPIEPWVIIDSSSRGRGQSKRSGYMVLILTFLFRPLYTCSHQTPSDSVQTRTHTCGLVEQFPLSLGCDRLRGRIDLRHSSGQ
ncbi:hypothetical protein L218DRAFT_620500 [Marasmius fiardii PR-910]|nr:hypothetical protein L218DRAFT_620500 [Marasmius fiardii PR-910]